VRRDEVERETGRELGGADHEANTAQGPRAPAGAPSGESAGGEAPRRLGRARKLRVGQTR